MAMRRIAGRRRQGAVLVLIAVGAATLIGMAGLAIDVGLAYRQHAAMQMACDAAALAGVVQLPASQTGGTDNMLAEAKRFAGLNGFTDGQNGCTVTGSIPTGSPNDYRVIITSNFAPLFTALVGAKRFTMSTAATARNFSRLPVSITGGGNPGQSNSITTLSVFGPYAYHSYGDAYSTKYLQNGQPNPSYNPNGFDFQITVPANYRTLFNTNILNVQVFDPDCGDNPGAASSGTDELRPNNTAAPAPPAGFVQNTTTQYSVFTVPNGFKDLTTQTQIAQATYGQDASVSNIWVTPTGFSINLDDYPGVTSFRLNVKAINGSSENGFNLRAGPPSLNQSTDWATTQADFSTAAKRSALDMIQASGLLPLNFDGSGTANIGLGTLPAANGTPYRVHIMKFDTDVGATGVNYTDTLGNTYPGTLAGNDQFAEDIINIPGTYAGGSLTAHYTAGASDTSSWSMTYEGAAAGLPGVVKLIE